MAVASMGTFSRRIDAYCLKQVAPHFTPTETERVRQYLQGLWQTRTRPPAAGPGILWSAVIRICALNDVGVGVVSTALRPIFDALKREIRASPRPPVVPVAASPVPPPPRRQPAPPAPKTPKPKPPAPKPRSPGIAKGPKAKKPGTPPRPIVEYPEPKSPTWEEVASFEAALDLHMTRHGDSSWHLWRAVVRPGERTDRRTIFSWRNGEKVPRSVESMAVLARIERRYRLPAGYFKAKLPNPVRAATGHSLQGIGPAERRRLAWHLPDDFDARPAAERDEIVSWVQSVIINGSTDYRRFQAAALKTRYALRFTPPTTIPGQQRVAAAARDGQGASISLMAPPALTAEIHELMRFKTATLTPIGMTRNGIWGDETADQKLEHLGLLFGALAASPASAVRGFGVPDAQLSLVLLSCPSVWDWYVQWRERRRGFYTAWEVNLLSVALGLTRKETGWLRQRPDMAGRLHAIPGLVSDAEAARANADWDGWCDSFYKFGLTRVRELKMVARVHRDPFEPILSILEAESPVGEYRKITQEILRLMPDARRYPRAAAESVRAFLLLRLGLHLGLRQKNLRQLLVCPRGAIPRTERQLSDLKRGELRWSDKDDGWEVLIPAVAFKNANSSYFGNKPFRLVLPDLGGLYPMIEKYLTVHRAKLLRNAADPGTFFVKTVKSTSADASFNQTTFYEAWRLAIQRFGIFNPYTGRGAIKGLLPHGPHNIRDVLATHILKKTGSYEQASYAIQDTPDMVAKHYGRFLPQDKAALAAQTLNKVWAA